MVVVVVRGDAIAAGRCAKRAVRQVKDIDEAKWRDLTQVQRRRFWDCVSSQEHIEIGYASFTRDSLTSIDHSYMLFDDISFPPDWDLALTAWTYGDIIMSMEHPEESRMTFKFDQVSSMRQGEYVQNQIRRYVDLQNTIIGRSHNSLPIQAADCLAGGISDDLIGDSNWLNKLSEHNVHHCPGAGLIQLENALAKHRTEP